MSRGDTFMLALGLWCLSFGQMFHCLEFKVGGVLGAMVGGIAMGLWLVDLMENRKDGQ